MADLFLKLDGIPGESVDDKHKGEIEIESFSWGLSSTGSASGGGGGGASKAQFHDLNLHAFTSAASPKLFVSAASGRHLKEALLTARRAGGKEAVDFYKVKLTDVLISSYNNAGSDDQSSLTDSFSLNFAKIEVSYAPQKQDGSLDTPITGGWDLKQNKEV